MLHCVETEIITPSESAFIADQNGTFSFFNCTFLYNVMSFLMRTTRKFISIACGTYSACKFQACRTSGSVCRRTIAKKYAYNNLMLHSRSSMHSVVMHFRSSACNRSLRTDYWTLNSHNINSVFAVNGWFMYYSFLTSYIYIYKASNGANTCNGANTHMRVMVPTHTSFGMAVKYFNSFLSICLSEKKVFKQIS